MTVDCSLPLQLHIKPSCLDVFLKTVFRDFDGFTHPQRTQAVTIDKGVCCLDTDAESFRNLGNGENVGEFLEHLTLPPNCQIHCPGRNPGHPGVAQIPWSSAEHSEYGGEKRSMFPGYPLGYWGIAYLVEYC